MQASMCWNFGKTGIVKKKKRKKNVELEINRRVYLLTT